MLRLLSIIFLGVLLGLGIWTVSKIVWVGEKQPQEPPSTVKEGQCDPKKIPWYLRPKTPA